MGKVLLIIVLLVSVILFVVMSYVTKKTIEIPDTISLKLAESQAKFIGSYALNYGLKQVMNGSISVASDSSFSQEYTNFYILGDGRIDSLRYTAYDDTISISAFVFYEVNGHQVYHDCEIEITTTTKIDIATAISTSGTITISGSAEVNGDIVENFCPAFEDIFGADKDFVKSNANNYYVDPANNVTPIENVTWVEFVSQTGFHITDNNYEGSGILIVNGDFIMTGGTFNGIIWVIGNLTVSGNPTINGAIFVESDIEVEEGSEVTFQGNCEINFTEGAVDDAMLTLPTALAFKILKWQN
ncbi:MAG: hypothetical protein HQ534_02435 [Armatimonadetes bacterium]|nr:hypothetical protein [Armatimonadota bacterium]